MRLSLRAALFVGVLSLMAVPAVAMGGKPTNVPPVEPGNGPNYNPAPSPPPHAKAYGYYCQGQSKKHVEGQKRTPFAECVLAMTKAANHPGLTPREACKGESKKHVKGQKRTPFAECVVAAAHLRHDEQQAQSS